MARRRSEGRLVVFRATATPPACVLGGAQQAGDRETRPYRGRVAVVATVDGLLLAAGAGTRMGLPKALVVGDDGTPWLHRALRVLQDGGCRQVTVVLGAAAEEAAVLVAQAPVEHQAVHVVVAADWAEGMGASLRAGLAAIDPHVDAAVVTLVDLPDLTAEVVRRVVAAEAGPAALARATYDGTPGHPVLLGRDHWDGVIATAIGDAGARDYLEARDVTTVECGDLATGRDVDTRARTDAG